MKRLLFFSLLLMFISLSCATVEKSSLLEDELLVTRKYVGNFIEYKQTTPVRRGDPNLIWIKTTLENTYGKISAYSNECNFKINEGLYMRRIYNTPNIVIGYWDYQIENSSGSYYYRLCEFQNDNKVSVKSWF